MKTLVIDTSTQVMYLSILSNDEILYEKILLGKNNHSENLIKEIKKGLEKLNLEVKDFSKIIVGIGPGSYTGLRVSLVVAKMFSWTLNIPLYTVSSLDMIASGFFDNDGKYLIKTKAKRGYVYCKLVEIRDGKYHEVISDKFLSIEEFEKLINNEMKIISEDNFSFNPLNLVNIKNVDDIYLLEPNYLRGEL
ncbi:MAG TPA: tRNA (adenosine(37)-N6)-threonylcarbamoyltransferase complex dimerization subunit type 1 TsaB [Acholeplasmataceae bacterium]|nr:tRNA (adenosine(37)-N6)-threonylcarbamoyltransferase complex dimerization subunit type 1 TsaB [Acholeplasmataceae bacterium]